MNNITDAIEYTKLCVANNEVEADIIISLLACEDILTNKKYNSSGEYLKIATGYNFQGVIIEVPSDKLELAQDILNAVVPNETSFEDNELEDLELEEMIEVHKKKAVIGVRIFIAIIAAIALIATWISVAS